MAISTFPAIFGKRYYSFTTLTGFTIGLVTGELFGHNPAGADYGHDHYGWAIWGVIFLFSIVMGVILEKLAKTKFNLKLRRTQIWVAIFIVGVVIIIVGIRLSMPTSFS